MADQEDTFLSRWARRKRDSRNEDEPAAEPADLAGQPAADPAEGDDAAGDDAAGVDPEVVAKLPDIESLDETSDFTPFMAKGVPDVLRRRALRKLWRLNPLFANLDGLNDYDEDFTDAANVLAEIKTIYKVGKGMVSKEAAEDTAAAEASVEEEPAEPQLAENAGEAPAISQTTSAVPEDEAGLNVDVRPEDAPEPVPLPEEDGKTIRGKPADTPTDTPTGTPTATHRRSAAARRWGESSG